ncbi:hypothetical protein H9Y04_27340 [Streptomyces sp. TRM66268-LWL]|uniref:IS1 family transposase n=1 Tax=Streptomyces polyasparticus TaxID=2767826 RepID=A0ABR7SLE8_9ACTN|nr:hypothetical protein [Streptomyces polyasparticus]MBC9716257.1 hypothetical protein [Streptomyces polyasparticus]
MPGSSLEEEENLLGVAGTQGCLATRVALICPSCGSTHVAQVLGDNGGISYVCTACGHSWS